MYVPNACLSVLILPWVARCFNRASPACNCDYPFWAFPCNEIMNELFTKSRRSCNDPITKIIANTAKIARSLKAFVAMLELKIILNRYFQYEITFNSNCKLGVKGQIGTFSDTKGKILSFLTVYIISEFKWWLLCKSPWSKSVLNSITKTNNTIHSAIITRGMARTRLG